MVLKSGKQLCAKTGCQRLALKNGTGLCYSHDPVMREKRQAAFVKRGILKNSWVPSPEKNCKAEGCKQWSMRDGSHLCFWHNPATADKRQATITRHAQTRRSTQLAPERRCAKPGCRGGAIRNDPSGLCPAHQPEIQEDQRKRMKGKPWLGLGNMKEARGLLFYSLETDQPLLTLRALTKIASLRRQERLVEAAKKKLGKEEAEGPGTGRAYY